MYEENASMQTTTESLLGRIILEFSREFNGIPEFKFIKKDKSDRDIFIHKIDGENIGIFGKMMQSAKIILKVKRYEKENRWLQNFDFSYEFFTLNNQRQGFAACYYVYDEERDTFKEYKN